MKRPVHEVVKVRPLVAQKQHGVPKDEVARIAFPLGHTQLRTILGDLAWADLNRVCDLGRSKFVLKSRASMKNTADGDGKYLLAVCGPNRFQVLDLLLAQLSAVGEEVEVAHAIQAIRDALPPDDGMARGGLTPRTPEDPGDGPTHSDDVACGNQPSHQASQTSPTPASSSNEAQTCTQTAGRTRQTCPTPAPSSEEVQTSTQTSQTSQTLPASHQADLTHRQTPLNNSNWESVAEEVRRLDAENIVIAGQVTGRPNIHLLVSDSSCRCTGNKKARYIHDEAAWMPGYRRQYQMLWEETDLLSVVYNGATLQQLLDVVNIFRKMAPVFALTFVWMGNEYKEVMQTPISMERLLADLPSIQLAASYVSLVGPPTKDYWDYGALYQLFVAQLLPVLLPTLEAMGIPFISSRDVQQLTIKKGHIAATDAPAFAKIICNWLCRTRRQ